ncbi:glycosyltransferase family 2 protein [Candidatus Bathyarchaeota archaeon]|nr:glycosyltransferase family 2 protein [Candidatus Bathyarchaeota archaeon]
MFEDLISVRKPKISVITPSLNHGRFLVDTIESILSQSYRNFEHIVVDGGSKDNTVDILKRYPHIKWISEKDENITEAFRKGFDMSRGEYIIQCCVSDGFLDKDWFKRCVKVLESDIEVSLVWGLPQYMLEDGSLSAIAHAGLLDLPVPQKTDFLPFWLATGFLLPEGNYCMRRGVFDMCFPRCQPDDPYREHPVSRVIYNFNSLGYLPYFIPVVANYGRWHEGQLTVKCRHIAKPFEIKYYRSIRAYRNALFKGKTRHCFRNGASEVIKTVDSDELKYCRNKTREYRLTQSLLWRANLALLHKKIRRYGLKKFLLVLWEKIFRGVSC